MPKSSDDSTERVREHRTQKREAGICKDYSQKNPPPGCEKWVSKPGGIRCKPCNRRKNVPTKDWETNVATRLEANTEGAYLAVVIMKALNNICGLRDRISYFEKGYDQNCQLIRGGAFRGPLREKPAMWKMPPLPESVALPLVSDLNEWLGTKMRSLRREDFLSRHPDSAVLWYAAYRCLKQIPQMEDRSHEPKWQAEGLPDTQEFYSCLLKHAEDLALYEWELRKTVKRIVRLRLSLNATPKAQAKVQ